MFFVCAFLFGFFFGFVVSQLLGKGKTNSKETGQQNTIENSRAAVPKQSKDNKSQSHFFSYLVIISQLLVI